MQEVSASVGEIDSRGFTHVCVLFLDGSTARAAVLGREMQTDVSGGGVDYPDPSSDLHISTAIMCGCMQLVGARGCLIVAIFPSGCSA